jgi:prephenate dehydratase
MMKIESRPVHGRPWQYRFYLDLQAAASDPEIAAALDELRSVVVELKVLGSYKAAELARAETVQSIEGNL